MRFLFPQNGDCINKNDGEPLEVRVEAPADAEIYVDGAKAALSDGAWTARVNVNDYKTAITAALKEALPSYMIPNIFMQVEAMPMTKNGKIDRNALMELYTSKKRGGRNG